MREYKTYPVWDAQVRWFHWINLLCVLGLTAVGLAILNDKALGVSNDGKVLLKTTHVWIGYVFAVNLCLRLAWAFVGGIHARWRSILPFGRGYPAALRRYLAAVRAGPHPQYLGHNPIGRIAVALMLLLLVVMAVTGLSLAGTDLFYPPFGAWIADWVAAPGVDPASLVPYAPSLYDPEAYSNMRAMRSPVVRVHLYGFYVLLALAILHIAGVLVAELRGGGNLVSAMFTGKKILLSPLSERNDVSS
jgi:Ni/Fe-hydrogenase 1 B-type cytochrome subunit